MSTVTTTPQEVTVSQHGQDLYIIPSGSGFSCLGFDVCMKRAAALAKEMNAPGPAAPRGSIEAYNEYIRLTEKAAERHRATGWRSQSELIPEFIGHEGRRVEVIDAYGEKRRFIIGKSTGVIPCHLEIKTRRSSGGGSVTGHPFKNWRFID